MRILRIAGPWGVIAKQAMIGSVGTVGFAVLSGCVGALSFGAGVVCVVIPSAYFAWTSQQTMEPGRIVGQGVVKVLSTAVHTQYRLPIQEILNLLLKLTTHQTDRFTRQTDTKHNQTNNTLQWHLNQHRSLK